MPNEKEIIEVTKKIFLAWSNSFNIGKNNILVNI